MKNISITLLLFLENFLIYEFLCGVDLPFIKGSRPITHRIKKLKFEILQDLVV